MTIAWYPNDPLSDYEQWKRATQKAAQSAGDGATVPYDPDSYDQQSGGTQANQPVNGGLAPPTNLVLATGTFYNDNFIDVSWTASTDPNVNEYEVEVTKTGFGVVAFIRTAGSSTRVNNVEPAQGYSMRVRGIALSLGNTTNYLGPSSITTSGDASFPRQVTGVSASAGMKTVVIEWDENGEEDVKNGRGLYHVDLDTTNTFNSGNYRWARTSALIIDFGDLNTGTTYYARVKAIDSSGNFSPIWSATVSATPGGAGSGDIQNGSVGNDHIAVAGLSAAHIKFGTMHGDRIDVNTLNANRITTSELNAAIVTIAASGMIRTGRTVSPFHYMIWDAAGIRGYANGSAAFTGGALNLEYNVSTGAAYFSGTINASVITGGTFRTAASGQRVEMVDSTPDEIRFYSGNANETDFGEIRSEFSGDQIYWIAESARRTATLRWGQIATWSRSGAEATCQASIRTVDTVNTLATISATESSVFAWVGSNTQRRLSMSTSTVQLLYGDASNAPWVNVFSTSAALRRGGDTQPGVYVFDAAAEMRRGLTVNERVQVGSGYAQMLYNDFDYVGVQLGFAEVALGANRLTGWYNSGWGLRTEFHRPVVLNRFKLYTKDGNDNEHILGYASAGGFNFDGTSITGWSGVMCRTGGGGDVGEFVDAGVNEVKTVTKGNTAWLNHTANNHQNVSDRRFKTQVVPAETGCLQRLRATQIRKYRIPHEEAATKIPFNARERIGMFADEAPDEVRGKSQIGNPNDPENPLREVDVLRSAEMDAYLWRAIQELADMHDESRAKVNEVIDSLPSANRPGRL